MNLLISDKHIALLEKQLDRFHYMLDTSLPEEDEYMFALGQIDRIMAALAPAPGLSMEERLLLEAPGPEDVM